MPKRKKKSYTPANKTPKISPSWERVEGILHLHPRGFGFVTVEGPYKTPDIFIPKHLVLSALDGDRVAVEVHPVVSIKGPEGRIVEILKRARLELVGTVLEVTPTHASVYVPQLGENKQAKVPIKKIKLQPLDRVALEVVEWGGKFEPPVCRITKKLKPLSDPSGDAECSLYEFGIESEFSQEAIDEAKAFGNRVPQKEIAQRRDLRGITTVTIDPTTAKDFDDAISISEDKQGFLLGVHIADVAFYVRPGTHIDEEAQRRSNSTYFPGKCYPMIPSTLSDELCSLKPNVNRLTVSVMMRFSPKGDLVDYEIFRSTIKSSHRFTYEEAKQVLDGKKKSIHAPMLHLMVALCAKLKEKRAERGSVEFSIPERSIIVDPNGVPTGVTFIPYDITHQLVEEFMLKANEMVAIHLTNTGKGVTFRIHEEPDPSSLSDFAEIVESFGETLPKGAGAFDFQSLFDRMEDSPIKSYLITAYIRCMKLATYSPHNIGHFGLSLTHYCHFTSPIRRYVDLVAHRLLFQEALPVEDLESIALHASERERKSAKAEMSVQLLKKLRLLETLAAERQPPIFDAVITKVKAFGISFELVELGLEGFLHISELKKDYFIFDSERGRLTGERTGKVLTHGMRIRVLLNAVDLIRKQSSWNVVW